MSKVPADALAPSLDDIEDIARASFAALPGNFRDLVGAVPIRVTDFPDDEVMRELLEDIDLEEAVVASRRARIPG